MSFLGKTISKIVGNQSRPVPVENASVQTNEPSTVVSKSTATTPTSSSFFSRNHSITYSNQFQQDAQLTLTHLRKVFFEYLHPKHTEINANEQDEKLYNILPLFIKVKKFENKVK